MGSSAAESRPTQGYAVPQRVGAAFKLLMRIRMLTTTVTLLVLPTDKLTIRAFLLVLSVAALSWLAAKHGDLIVPRLLAHPLLVMLDIAVSTAVLGIGGPTGPFLLATVITAAVAGLLFGTRGMLVVSALQTLCYYGALGFALEEQSAGMMTFQVWIGQPIYYPLVGFAGVALRRLFDDQAEQDAARRRAEVVAAAAEERTRLAREMHDSLAKTLRGISLAAAALPVWVRRDAGRAIEEAQNIAAATEIASREARSLISGLRDDVVTRPLSEVVREIVEKWAAEQKIAVRVEVDADADLPVRTRYEAMAILGETLANVERHAAAHTACIRLSAEPAQVVLMVHDDGRGFQTEGLRALARAGHYGLVGLHERAERVGGTVTVTSAPGSGTTVTAQLPVTAESPDLPLVEVS